MANRDGIQDDIDATVQEGMDAIIKAAEQVGKVLDEALFTDGGTDGVDSPTSETIDLRDGMTEFEKAIFGDRPSQASQRESQATEQGVERPHFNNRFDYAKAQTFFVGGIGTDPEQHQECADATRSVYSIESDVKAIINTKLDSAAEEVFSAFMTMLSPALATMVQTRTVHEIQSNLIDSLLQDTDRPVFFVGHSEGGALTVAAIDALDWYINDHLGKPGETDRTAAFLQSVLELPVKLAVESFWLPKEFGKLRAEFATERELVDWWNENKERIYVHVYGIKLDSAPAGVNVEAVIDPDDIVVPASGFASGLAKDLRELLRPNSEDCYAPIPTHEIQTKGDDPHEFLQLLINRPI